MKSLVLFFVCVTSSRIIVVYLAFRRNISTPSTGRGEFAVTKELLLALKFGCLCPVVVHNDYVVLDRHTHNTFTGITILL
jgi:hypothetical protein